LGGSGVRGEVDVIAGKLSPSPPIPPGIETGGDSSAEGRAFIAAVQRRIVSWPAAAQAVQFDVSRLVGIEVKCAYVDASGVPGGRYPEVKANKCGPGKIADARKQLTRLTTMGLDCVGLLEVIAGPPVSMESIEESIQSFAVATWTVDRQLNSPLAELTSELGVGHCRAVLSPTCLSQEGTAGACRVGFPRPPKENARLCEPEIQQRRELLLGCVRRAIQEADAKVRVIGAPIVLDRTPEGAFQSNQDLSQQPTRHSVDASDQIVQCLAGVQLGPGESLFMISPEGIPVGPPTRGS
jgi:hypothetical protein